MKRIVITGIGMASPFGAGVETFWNSLLAGESRHGFATFFDTSALNSHKVGEVKNLDPAQLVRRRGVGIGTRTMQLGLVAARLALDHAGIDVSSIDPDGVGVVFGAGWALNTLSELHERLVREGPRYADPGLFPQTAVTAPACHISIMFGFRAFNATFANGETAGLDAMNYAANMLRAGCGELALVGGVYELSYKDYLGFSLQNMLATRETGSEELCRPFDAHRNGMILAEGSAVLIMELLDSALQKGRTPIAEVSGYANTFDPLPNPGYDLFGRGARAAMQFALRAASRRPEQVDLVFASANGGREADAMESRALIRVFPRHSMPKITAIKSSLGDTYCAGGIFQVAAGALAIQKSSVPPTLHFKRSGLASRIVPVTTVMTGTPVRTALVNAFGKIGNNSSVVLTAA